MKAKVPNHAALPLEDSLAELRTLLAIERTFLAYVRSALAIFISGVSLFQFFQNPVFRWIGLLLIPVCVAVLLFGLYRYSRLRAKVLKGYILELPGTDTQYESEE